MKSRQALPDQTIPKAIWRASLPLLFGLLTAGSIPLIDSIYVSHYSTEAFNALAMAIPIIILVSALASALAAAAGNAYARARSSDERQTELRAAIALALTGGLALVIAAIAGTGLILAWYQLELGSQPAVSFLGYWHWILPTLPLYLLFGCLLQILVAAGRTAQANISVAVLAGVNFALDPLLIFTFDLGIQGAAIAADIAYLAANFATIYGARGLPGADFRFGNLRQLLRPMGSQMGTGFFIAAGTSTFLIGDLLFRRLAALDSPEAITAIGIADQVAMAFIQLSRGVVAGVIPVVGAYLAADRSDQLQKIYRSGTTFVAFLYGLAALLMIGTPALVSRAFGLTATDVEAPQILFLQITGLTLLINIPARLLPPILVGLGQAQKGMIYSIVAVVVGYVLTLTLLPHFGYLGIAIGRLGGFTFANLIGIPYLFFAIKSRQRVDTAERLGTNTTASR